MILKNCKPYEPVEKIYGEDVIYLQDESGADWYESQKEFKADTMKAVYDKHGVIVSCSRDVSALFPLDCSVIEVDTDKADLLGLYVINENVIFEPKPSNAHEWNGKGWIISAENQTALLTQKKDELIEQLAKKTDTLKSSLLVGYPQTEIDSFYRQEKEALAYQVNSKADTPMLRQIAQVRGIPFDVLVAKVIEKSSQFAVTIGAIIGARQAFEDRILAATEQSQLDEIEREVNAWQLSI
ncbi:hypothetical protein [Necropsobacter rosorum]|uniref:hypothetical protein n=1 Tax=Necropsobacter rosorum TaxID=908285 RepID=UPI003C7EA1BA